MTTINSISRQPTQQDYASPSQFKFSMAKLPKVEFFCTEVNIPGISLGNATQLTTLRDIPLPGTKLEFGDLSLTFLVDEKLQNYQELFRWIMAIGFPEDRAQFKSFRQENVGQFPTSQSKINAPSDTPKPRTPDGAMYSDATLTILSNKNNPVLNVNFSNVYPVSLSALQYTNDQSDTQYMSATATFQYQLFKFESL